MLGFGPPLFQLWLNQTGYCLRQWNEMLVFRPLLYQVWLTHWGRVTHICVGNLIIIGPDNGLSPGQRQAIIWTNAGILLIRPWGTNFNDILIGIHTFSFKKISLKMSSVKWRPFCLGLNVLNQLQTLWDRWLGDTCSWHRCRDGVGLNLTIQLTVLHR